jgi:hypothetical protein
MAKMLLTSYDCNSIGHLLGKKQNKERSFNGGLVYQYHAYSMI